MSDKFEYNIKNAILKGTDKVTEQKDKVWENISKKLHEDRRECNVMKKKKRVPFIPLSIAAVLAITILLALGLTEQGRDQFTKLKAFFKTNTEIPQEVKLVLIQSEKGYTIYIDEEQYKMLTSDTYDKIVPIDWEESDETFPYMKIQHLRDKNTSEVLGMIKTQIKNDYNITVSEEKVDTPIKGWMLSFSTDYEQEIYYVIDNENNGSFLIKQVYFLDDLEGHRANFDNMLSSFSIVDSNNIEDKKTVDNSTVDEASGEEASGEEVSNNQAVDKNLRKDFVWNIGDFEVRNGNILSDIVSLKSTNPVRKISSDNDIFPRMDKMFSGYVRYIPIFIKDNNTNIWATGEHKGFGHPSDTAIRIKITNGKKVYTSTRFYEESKDYDVEITDLLLEVGINISLAKVEILHESPDRYTLVYKISDGKNEDLYFTKLDVEKKTLKTIPLSRFNISFVSNDVYIINENQKDYICLWSDRENKLLTLEMPVKLDRVKNAYLYDNYLYINALKDNSKNTYFKVNLSTKEVTEYLTIKNLKDHYPLKWSFNSDLIQNNYVKSIADIIIVHATDGRFSGFHDHCYLYGINKNTGKRMWELYGYCLEYSISDDKKYIVGGSYNEDSPTIKCIEISTGKPIWSTSIEDYHLSSIVHYENNILVGNSESTMAYNSKTGAFLWNKNDDINNYLQAKDHFDLDNEFDSNEKIIHETLSGNDFHSGVQIVFDQTYSDTGRKLKAVNSKGSTLWEMDYNWFLASYDRYNFFQPIRINNTLYINMNYAMVALDVNTGEVLYQVADYPTRTSNVAHLGNEVYWLLNTGDGLFEALKLK